MLYSNIFKRPAILIHKDFIQLVQRLQSLNLNHKSKHCMLSVEVIDFFTKCDEELKFHSHLCGFLMHVQQPWIVCPYVYVSILVGFQEGSSVTKVVVVDW